MKAHLSLHCSQRTEVDEGINKKLDFLRCAGSFEPSLQIYTKYKVDEDLAPLGSWSCML